MAIEKTHELAAKCLLTCEAAHTPGHTSKFHPLGVDRECEQTLVAASASVSTRCRREHSRMLSLLGQFSQTSTTPTTKNLVMDASTQPEVCSDSVIDEFSSAEHLHSSGFFASYSKTGAALVARGQMSMMWWNRTYFFSSLRMKAATNGSVAQLSECTRVDLSCFRSD